MQCAEDLPIYFAVLLAAWAAFASVPRTGPDIEPKLIALLSAEAFAVDMPLAGSDGEQLFVAP